MGARLRSWWKALWQLIKRHPVLTGVVVLAVLVTLIIVGYRVNWTGFNGYTQVTTSHTISGTNAGTIVRTEVSQPGKAFWDWMQLLIIPAVLVVGGFLLNNATSRTEHEIASDKQREDALQAYIDNMSALLLEKKLRESGEDDEVRKIARVRTLTVLPRLDGKRKASVLQFLYESGLIHNTKETIDLHGADLSGANLYQATLFRASLSGADLSKSNLSGASLIAANLDEANLDEANLSGASLYEANLDAASLSGVILCGANLSGAELNRADLNTVNLDGANLSGANLYGAKLTIEKLDRVASLKGATMPDGSTHP